MSKTEHKRNTPARIPPSPRPLGLPPVPPPEPWVPSKPAPASAPAKPSRRGVLASAAGLLAFGGTTAAVQAAPGAHPDAELIALCAAFDDLERRYRASFDRDSSAYVEDDDERDRVNDLIREAQDPLEERICAIRATTLDGWRARVRSILLWDAEADPAEDSLCLGHSTDRRMTAATFRDLLGDRA